MKKIIMVSLFTLVTIGFYSCGTSNDETRETKSDETLKWINSLKTWEYDDTIKNEMGEKTGSASILSTNKVDLKYPDDGGSYGVVKFVKTTNDLSAYFEIRNGEFDDDIEYDRVIKCYWKNDLARIKFDDESPIKWKMGRLYIETPDKVAWFENGKKLLEKFKKSKKVVIELPFYHSGDEQFIFNTKGLTFL